MKKRICILLLAAFMLLLIPHVASANAPIPWYIEIDCANVEEGTQIEVVFQKEDGTTRTQIAETRTQTIGMGFETDETSFCLICTAPDGTETRTESVKLIGYGRYRYDGAANSLTANGTYYPRGGSCGDGMLTAVLIVLAFVLPLGLTLLIEFLAALCFRIRPKKYVVVINLITNPVMNLILLLLTMILGPGQWVYWTVLAVLELAVVGLEFLFYTKKCREIPRGRLLVFTFIANLLSFAAGVGIISLLM